VSYLLIDGHGSTQQITNSSGAVTAVFRYDAFGDAINFNPATAPTVFLFGGDAIYDPVSGLEFHGDGTRPTDGFIFVQRDFGPEGMGDASDPITFNAYLFANSNPIYFGDPSGHVADADTTVASLGSALLDSVQNLAIRGATLYARAVVLAMRGLYYGPTIFAGLSLAGQGLSFLAGAAHRWAELQAVPAGWGARGNFLHQQAGMNLAQNFPKIDDFRNGFATSIKSFNRASPDGLLNGIKGALNEISDIQQQTLRGSDANGNPLIIEGSQIQGKGLLVAIPGAQGGWVADPVFIEEVKELSEEFQTVVRIVPVDAFQE
jgi:hypothetical protein